MTDLFDAVRRLAPTEAWSSGVTLARSGAVSLESDEGGEIRARITVPGAAVSPRVALYLADREWECDCASPLDACEHVAAVVIAMRQGIDAPSERPSIEYRLRRTPEGLHFERGVEDAEGFHPIDVPLDAIASGRRTGPRFDASPEDLAVERALRGWFRGLLEKGAVARVFEALSRAERVTLDGARIRVSPEPSVRPVVVEDAEGGFLVRLGESPDVRERFRNGVVVAGETLRPEGEPRLTGREWDELGRGRLYGAHDVAALVGEVIPSLRGRARVDLRTEKLPHSVRERPRLSLYCKREGENLYVLPRIVYGEPPRARVEGDRFVGLGEGVPLRDLEGERKLQQDLLRRFGLRLQSGVELPPEEAIAFVARLEGFDGAVEGEAHEDFRLHGALEARLAAGDDDFDVSFEAKGRRASPGLVLRAHREGRSLVPLLEGGFARLPTDWLHRFGDAIEDLLAAREAGGRLTTASLPDLARLAEDLDAPRPARFEELKALVSDFSGLPEAPIPRALRAVLRDYQRKGADWLYFLRKAALGGLLADDMGLGKTVQALAVLEGRCLVVAPTSVLRNWTDEAARFRRDLVVRLYHGPGRKLDPEADVTVTSHALLRLDREALAAVTWDVVVLDEAQAVRNPETDLARSAYALEARFRIGLTGTPIENRLVDLWSQMHFLNPGFLGGLASFEERYVRPVERGDAKPLERLRERLRPFLLRRLKREVAPELPPRTESVLRAELDQSERSFYETVKLAARRDVLSRLERGGSALHVLEALLRLRQAACHPALVPGFEARTSSKMELLLSSLETAAAEGHKSLVFSQWTSLLDLLEPRLAEGGHRFVRLDGSTRDRGGVVDRFQKDPDVSVFLVSLKAGGTGLNLTAADHVFLFDPWWNPAVEEQAFDRAHRIGQDKPVFVYRLVATDTVEERILDLQREKRALAEMATGLAPLSLTREDLLRLLD